MSRIVLVNGAPPSPPTSGKVAIYCDTDLMIKQKDQNGVVRVLGAQTAKMPAPIPTSGTGETMIFNFQVPANSVAVGDMFWISCHGISSSTGTLIFKVKAGAGGTISDTAIWTALTSAAQVANQRAGFDGLFVVRSVGAGGTVQCECLGYAQAALLPTVVGAVTTPTVNTTGIWYIDIVCTCSVGTWTCQEAIISKQ
jgi:hypothetical protein